MDDPSQTPGAPSAPEAQAAPADLMPFEEKGRALSTRLWETVGLILRDPVDAGRRLGAGRSVGAAVAFFAWVGLPLQWATQAITTLRGAGDPAQNEMLLRMLHMPPQPAPTPEQLALTRMFGWMSIVLAPLGVAVGFLLLGLVAHGGLWIFGALRQRRGLEVTFRALLYVAGATAWVGFLNALLLLLPGPSFRILYQVLAAGLGLGVLTFQGIVLGHAHGERPWKGVLALLLPLLLLFCLLACCLGALLAASGSLPA